MPTISFKVSEKQEEKIDKEYKKKGYLSRSEFIRDILREALQPELSEETVQAIKEARKQEGEPAEKVWKDLGIE